MAGRKKTVLVTVFIIIILGAATGFYLWNKPHTDVAGAEGIKVDAATLYKAFTTDSVEAKKDFLQKVVEVTGPVHTVSKNQQNQTVITLNTATDGAYINCTLEGEGNISTGSSVTLKGICQGIGQGDADLGIMGDVYLVRCYMAK